MNCIVCKSEFSKKNVTDVFLLKDLKKIYFDNLSVDVFNNSKNDTKFEYINCPHCDARFFSPVISAEEKFYEHLSKNEWYYPVEKYEFDFVADFINSKKLSVLEIGAGRGSFAKKVNFGIDYLGLEFNDNAVLMAQKNNIKIVKKSMSDIKNENEKKYDVVLSFQVLEHVESPFDFLSEKLSLVNDGGFLVFAVPSYDSFFKNITNHILDLPPHHLSRWSDKCITKIADIFNLDLVEIKHEPLEPIHYRFFIEEKIKSILIIDRKMIRTDFYFKLVFKISMTLAKVIVPFVKPYLRKQRGGHVVAIYKKRLKFLNKNNIVGI